MKKIFFIVPRGMILLTGMLAISCKSNETSQAPRDPRSRQTPVEAIILKPKPFSPTFSTTGTLLANEEIEIRSEVPGKITGIFFEEGQRVSQDTRLVKIYDQDLQAQLLKIEAQIELALEDEKRKHALFEQQLASKEDYETAVSRRKVLEADRHLIRTQIARTEILAPFDGTIGLRNVSPGAYVTSNTVIATLIQHDPMKIDFQFPNRYQNMVKTGTVIPFRQIGDPNVYQATLYAIDPKADHSTRMIRARARVANPNRLLKAGTMVQLDLPLETIPQALMIPAEALIPELNGQKVFVYKNGLTASAQVKTGIRTETQIQIIEGLTAGDTVVTTGLLQIREGMPITLRSIKTQ